jgi:hypothetical protein
MRLILIGAVQCIAQLGEMTVPAFVERECQAGRILAGRQSFVHQRQACAACHIFQCPFHSAGRVAIGAIVKVYSRYSCGVAVMMSPHISLSPLVVPYIA